MRLKQRVTKLEGTTGGIAVVIVHRELTETEKQELAERHRQERGLPPDTPVIVLGEPEASL